MPTALELELAKERAKAQEKAVQQREVAQRQKQHIEELMRRVGGGREAFPCCVPLPHAFIRTHEQSCTPVPVYPPVHLRLFT